MATATHRDSFTTLRERTRWRIAVVLCVFGLLTMVALGVLNARDGRQDSVRLAIAVFVVLAACLAMLLRLPKAIGGRVYFWLSVAILAYLPYFGWQQGRTFHYWAYVLPPVLFFVMRPKPALVAMIAFGVYAAAMVVPFTPATDVGRFLLSYLLLVGFMYTYALLEERAAAMLRHFSAHDPLTNCFNRRTFNETLAEIEASTGRGEPCAVLLIDIDHFKAINDRLGHLVGDRVITQTAALLGRGLAPGVRLYRYGGEEFAILAPGLHEDQAVALGERLRRAVEAADFEHTRVTVSVGVAQWTGGGGALATALAAADDALYAAKRGGRNRVERPRERRAPAPAEPAESTGA
jgi:diguanylate cyclase (GGDEF)-like protein